MITINQHTIWSPIFREFHRLRKQSITSTSTNNKPSAGTPIVKGSSSHLYDYLDELSYTHPEKHYAIRHEFLAAFFQAHQAISSVRDPPMFEQMSPSTKRTFSLANDPVRGGDVEHFAQVISSSAAGCKAAIAAYLLRQSSGRMVDYKLQNGKTLKASCKALRELYAQLIPRLRAPMALLEPHTSSPSRAAPLKS